MDCLKLYKATFRQCLDHDEDCVYIFKTKMVFFNKAMFTYNGLVNYLLFNNLLNNNYCYY